MSPPGRREKSCPPSRSFPWTRRRPAMPSTEPWPWRSPKESRSSRPPGSPTQPRPWRRRRWERSPPSPSERRLKNFWYRSATMKLEEVVKARKGAASMLKKARIAITPREEENIEISDFGLGDLDNVGLLVVIYESNDRYCAKEIVLLPRQICPEHRHPPVGEKNIG